MDESYDRIAYLRKPAIRAEIALACRDEPATKAQIARRLGREPGSLSAIDTLEKKGVLRRVLEGGEGDQKATRWLLERNWLEAAESAMEHVKVGILSAGLDLVLVPAADVAAACELFSGADSKIAWGAPLQGEQLGLVLCPSGKGEAPALQLLAELNRSGARPLRLHLSKVFDREELANWAADIAQNRRLPEGS